MKRSNYIVKHLDILFPNAKCELNSSNNFEFLVAVVLSAQTTDEKVNKVTPVLFKKYNSVLRLSKAKIDDVENIIKPLGLYKNKAKSIIALSNKLHNDFNDIVPNNYDELVSLPGVGRKTANVVLNNCFDVPAFGVDTHVSRISKRLTIAEKEDDVLQIEEKLMNYFPKKLWGKLHHQFIFFGRYKCKAIKPDCIDCPFKDFCTYFE